MKQNLALPKEIKLNQTQVHTLLILREHGPVSMHVLGRLTGIVKGSLTQVVDALVAENLVERKRDTDDRRSVVVLITPEGRRMTKRLDDNLIKHTKDILENFDESQTRELISALKIIHKSLDQIEKREDYAAE